MSKKCLDVAMIPRFGTDDSALWYGQYHALVRTVPHNGTDVAKEGGSVLLSPIDV